METTLPRLTKLEPFSIPLDLDGVRVDISGLDRAGAGKPFAIVHGIGSTKVNDASLMQRARVSDCSDLAYDAPGCSEISCPNRNSISAHVHAAVANEVLVPRTPAAFSWRLPPWEGMHDTRVSSGTGGQQSDRNLSLQQVPDHSQVLPMNPSADSGNRG